MGAGRLGTALARALVACGYDVRALVARRASHARRAVEASGARAVALATGRLEELPPSDILFITTPDGSIAEVAERLAALADTRPARGRVALHTSGALSSEELAPLRERGFSVGSMHPLAAVSEPEAGAESLRRAYYCVEGDRRAAGVARRVVRDLGARSFSVRPEDKALYHAAAVMSAGHAVALFDLASGVLARCGLTAERAREVLLPLTRSALDNLERQPPEKALTGTFARGDAATVRKHLAALRAPGGLDALTIYVVLGAHSLRLAKRRKGAKPGETARILADLYVALSEELTLRRDRDELDDSLTPDLT